ncbi:MAG: hypothetical protein E7549_06170 [Ruminococcaceae bacterium]|nr:hypothetical protein [Oscillospiraceae bacterium]
MLKRNAFVWCLIGLLLFSLTACAKKKPLETTATTTTETTTQTMLLTTEGAAVTTTETTLPVTEGIEVTTTTETGTTTTERTTLPEEQRTTVICSLPTTILCTVTTTELPPATTTRLTGPDTVVTAPQTSWNPSTTTTTATAPTTARLVIVRTTENGPMYKTIEDAEEAARVAAYVEALCNASLEREPAAGWHTMLRFENGDTAKAVTFDATSVSNGGKRWAVTAEAVATILSLYDDLPMQALPYDFKQ